MVGKFAGQSNQQRAGAAAGIKNVERLPVLFQFGGNFFDHYLFLPSETRNQRRTLTVPAADKQPDDVDPHVNERQQEKRVKKMANQISMCPPSFVSVGF